MSCNAIMLYLKYSRKYPEGWSSDEGRDPQLEFRISIMHAVKDDSGTFTCVTPARHTHSVEVIVKVQKYIFIKIVYIKLFISPLLH